MNDENWHANGWDDHETFRLEVTRHMSFRARLQWLEDAHDLVQRLNKTRRWIDKDGVIHEPTQDR